jgi:hypothetical protein
MSIRGRFSIASLYYYVTPVFVLLDYFGGVSVRVTVLDSMPFYKNLYYGFCVLCGVAAYALPRLTPFIAVFEGVINFLMTVLAVFLPWYQFITKTTDFLTAKLPVVPQLDTFHLVNLALAGGIAIIGFHGSLREIGLEGHHDMESK